MKEEMINKQFGSLQGLIGEYESKTDKPSLEGFSMWLERKKQYYIREYQKYQDLKKQKLPRHFRTANKVGRGS